MRGTLIGFALLGCVALAGCGDTETTIINSTTVTTTTAPETVTAVPTTTSSTVAPDQPAPPPAEEPEPAPTPTDEDYSGPCGEAGVITGGTPGASATTAVPGYANVETENANCALASTVAVQWVDLWESSCLSGCARRIEGLQCKYGGSGSSVQCRSSKSGVAFDLGFQLTS